MLDFNEPFFYNEKKGLWLFYPNAETTSEACTDGTSESESAEDIDAEEDNADDCLTVEDGFDYCIAEFRNAVPDRACKHIVYFYEKTAVQKLYGEEALALLKETDGFIVYEKGMLEEAIRHFLASYDNAIEAYQSIEA